MIDDAVSNNGGEQFTDWKAEVYRLRNIIRELMPIVEAFEGHGIELEPERYRVHYEKIIAAAREATK
jgi:hypothetical protein